MEESPRKEKMFMANVEYVNQEEMLAKRATRQSIRKQVQAEYEGYLKGLGAGQAGKVIPDKGEKPSLVRDRLRSAAKRLGTPIQLRRRGGALYFKLKESEEKAPEPPQAAPDVAAAESPVKRTTRKSATAATAVQATNGAEPVKRGRGRQTSA